VIDIELFKNILNIYELNANDIDILANSSIENRNSLLNDIISKIRLRIKSEEILRITSQINIAIETRCKNFTSNKKSMINNLLEKDNKTIIIDKLIKKNLDGSENLITDEIEVKNIVKSHFEKIMNFT
jgi:hypothetical protein